MNIHIDHVLKKYGEKTAVDIPQLDIAEGEIIGLVGNNGAGKTTLFRIMLDLAKADNGMVVYTVDGKQMNPAVTEEWKQHTGAYLDERFLIDFLTPKEYLNFIETTNELPHTAFDKVSQTTQDTEHSTTETQEAPKETDTVTELLIRWGGNELFGSNKLIRDLSAGNKQKVGIIGALLGQPKILILDEPFNFLDPTGQIQLKHIIEAYNRQHRALCIISSHNLGHTVDISTRVLLMEQGRVVSDIDNRQGKAAAELNDYFAV